MKTLPALPCHLQSESLLCVNEGRHVLDLPGLLRCGTWCATEPQHEILHNAQKSRPLDSKYPPEFLSIDHCSADETQTRDPQSEGIKPKAERVQQDTTVKPDAEFQFRLA
mmetsp:Transcript_111528/g.221728  ORF Transcript_111528/g.221728 Transcript_111528/m.221728 type:complete len:110 (-) Transcript_111528:423-752(-)